MSGLPPALAPWAPQLDLFPRELALALGPLVRRLAAAFDQGAPGTPRGDGEPDGFDGLERRGAFSHLLLSEWLLADEVPDEFSRRAAMGELAFLRPARRSPDLRRGCVALFDAGPDQVGGPRLVHLAALVVLARRAEASGGTLFWGALARPDQPFQQGIAEDGIRAFLAMRGLRRAQPDHLSAWNTRLEGENDLWLVGAPRIASFRETPRAASVLTVAETETPDGTGLEARIAGRAPLRLDLPPAPLCARLLRAPFDIDRSHVPAVGATVGDSLLFAPGGRKIWTRSADRRSLVAIPVPNSRRQPPGTARRYEGMPDETLLAADTLSRSLVLCFLRGDHLRVHTPGKRLEPRIEGRYRLEPETASRLHAAADSGLRRCIVPRFADPSESGNRLWIETDARNWIRLELRSGTVGTALPLPTAPGFAARRQTDAHLILHFRDEGGVTQADRGPLDPPGGSALPIRARDLLIGYHRSAFLYAIRGDAAETPWHIVLDDTGTLTVAVEAHDDVIGVCDGPEDLGDDRLVLVTVSPGRRLVRLQGSGPPRTLPGFGGKIRSAAVSNDLPLLALALDTDELVVWHLQEQEIRARIPLAPARVETP